MKGKKMEQVKKYWWIIFIIFTIGGWVTFVEIGLGAEKTKNNKQDDSIQKLTEIVAKQQELAEKINGKIDVILQLIGVKVTDSLIHTWKVMPRKLPVDSMGCHVRGVEWLSISDDYLYARTFKWVKDDSLLVKIEWDKRK